MSLLKVTGFGVRDSEFGIRDSEVELLEVVSGARWQAMRKQSPTPNPNKASLVGSWELGIWVLNNLTKSLLALQCR